MIRYRCELFVVHGELTAFQNEKSSFHSKKPANRPLVSAALFGVASSKDKTIAKRTTNARKAASRQQLKKKAKTKKSTSFAGLMLQSQ